MSLIPQGTTVTIETKYFPPLTVDLGGGTVTGPGLGSYLTKFLKPKVTVSYQGQVLTSTAPAGEPVPNEWPKVRIALVVIGALAAFSVLRILK